MMKATFLVFTMLLTVAPAASLSFDLAEAKNRPVTKVLTLLKDMLKQLEKESAEDQEIYDELACWCKTNDKGKAEAISDAEDKIDILSDQISELTATSARLTNEIENLEKEIAANEAALAKATSVREKQLAAFTEEEKDLLESISSLSEALNVLSKHNAASFMQVQHKSMRDVGVSLQKMMKKHAPLLSGVLTRKERRAIASFVQAPQDYFDATPTFKQSYGAQSGEIFGVLGQLKESFEGDLASSQKDEETDQASYEGLKKAKTKEIESGMAMVDDKKDQLAETDEKNSAQKQDLEDTENALSADSKFLATLKQKCSQTDLEYEERLKTRRLEIEAVSKALVVLSGDDALDLQSRTFSFTQKASSAHSSRQAKASAFLTTVAKRLNNPRLATLAVRVRLDAFTKVKKAIDGMIVKLLEEKEAEIKKKDFCVDGFDENERQTQDHTEEKTDLETQMDDLKMLIQGLSDAIANIKAEIGDLQVQLKRSTEDREKQSKEFQQTLADQRATEALLEKALLILNSFYAKAASAALLQRESEEPAGPPPPPGFKEYKPNAGAAGVTGMIQQIIDDAKAMAAQAIKDETDAVAAYGAFVTDTNDSIKAKSEEMVDKSEKKAEAEQTLVETTGDHSSVVKELEQLASELDGLHENCDYIIKNFDIRQVARDEEVSALKQAKAILSGAKFEAFLERA
mmetsp:Transcript_118932/g.210317  ORF Transcript_118932/g.210317 Transcript_118932/m.210317 type:complete len:689 (+) Transcript_118932:77-2143(+)